MLFKGRRYIFLDKVVFFKLIFKGLKISRLHVVQRRLKRSGVHAHKVAGCFYRNRVCFDKEGIGQLKCVKEYFAADSIPLPR